MYTYSIKYNIYIEINRTNVCALPILFIFYSQHFYD